MSQKINLNIYLLLWIIFETNIKQTYLITTAMQFLEGVIAFKSHIFKLHPLNWGIIINL